MTRLSSRTLTPVHRGYATKETFSGRRLCPREPLSRESAGMGTLTVDGMCVLSLIRSVLMLIVASSCPVISQTWFGRYISDKEHVAKWQPGGHVG